MPNKQDPLFEKKSISFPVDLLDWAQKQATQRGGTLSGYIQSLIDSDKKGTTSYPEPDSPDAITQLAAKFTPTLANRLAKVLANYDQPELLSDILRALNARLESGHGIQGRPIIAVLPAGGQVHVKEMTAIQQDTEGGTYRKINSYDLLTLTPENHHEDREQYEAQRQVAESPKKYTAQKRAGNE